MLDPEVPENPPNAVPPPFDYSQLPDSVREAVLADTKAIHGLNAKLAHNAVQIGRELLSVRNKIGPKRFAAWRMAKFKMDQATASKYMRVATMFGGLEDLSQFTEEALFVLSGTKVSPAARTEAMRRALGGERITRPKAKAIVAGHSDAAPMTGAAKVEALMKPLRKFLQRLPVEDRPAVYAELARLARELSGEE